MQLITRGPMIVRDVDVLVELARRADVGITFSIPTLDHDVWQKTEPGTAPPRQRLRALKTLVEAGIKVGVGMAPILPGSRTGRSSSARSSRPRGRPARRESGRTSSSSGPGRASTSSSTWREDWPEQLPRYLELYDRRAYLASAETKPIRAKIAALAKEHGVRDRRRIRLDGTQHDEQLALAV